MSTTLRGVDTGTTVSVAPSYLKRRLIHRETNHWSPRLWKSEREPANTLLVRKDSWHVPTIGSYAQLDNHSLQPLETPLTERIQLLGRALTASLYPTYES